MLLKCLYTVPASYPPIILGSLINLGWVLASFIFGVLFYFYFVTLPALIKVFNLTRYSYPLAHPRRCFAVHNKNINPFDFPEYVLSFIVSSQIKLKLQSKSEVTSSRSWSSNVCRIIPARFTHPLSFPLLASIHRYQIRDRDTLRNHV